MWRTNKLVTDVSASTCRAVEGVNPISRRPGSIASSVIRAEGIYYCAYVEDSLEFDRPVRFRESGFYLRKRTAEGRRLDEQRQVRPFSEAS